MRARRLLRAAATGPLRPLAAPVFDALVRAELALARGPAGADRSVDDRLTVMIKTFERPRVVRRLVDSIRRRYPSLPIVVVDDSRRPAPIAGTESVVLGFDSGVSAGRQAGLDRVRTAFVLVLDDDMIFGRGTDLAAALRRIETEPSIDILGGQLIDVPLWRRLPPPRGAIFPTRAVPRVPLGSRINGLEVVDKVATFYVARTERLRLVGWRPELKRLDHADFFTRALGVLVTVFDPALRAYHAQTPFDRGYMARRLDFAADELRLAARWRRAPG